MGTALVPTTLSEAMHYAETLAKSNFVPAAYRNKPEDILPALQMGAELGLAPLQALQNIASINGKPSIYGDAALALVKSSHVCEDVREEEIGNPHDGDRWGYRCTAIRRGKAPVVVTFTVADAKKAGLWGKAGPWQSYPKRMLQMRARGFALRDAFPDVLKGLITAEEAQDIPEKVINPLPAQQDASTRKGEGGAGGVVSGREPVEPLPEGAPMATPAAADPFEPDPVWPLLVPGKTDPHGKYPDKDAWSTAYSDLEDRLCRNAKMKIETKKQKLRQLWEVNELMLVGEERMAGEELASWRDARSLVIGGLDDDGGVGSQA